MDGQLLKDLVAVRVREELSKGVASSTSSSSSSSVGNTYTYPFSYTISYLSTQTIFIGTGSTAVATTIGSFTPKDILQLRSDIEKLRTHQSFLDHIYTELKDYVSIREKKAEEAYRKSLGGEITITHTERNICGCNGSSSSSGSSFTVVAIVLVIVVDGRNGSSSDSSWRSSSGRSSCR